MDLSTIRFSADDSRLVRAVKSSPRLTALLPATELEELVTAHDTAVANAAAVGKLRTESVDFLDLLDKDLRAGKKADPAALVAKVAAAESEAAAIRAVAQRLSELPNHYRQAVVRLVQDSAETMWLDLADQLDAVIARGTELLNALGGATNADDAIDAGVADAWSAMKLAAADYRDIRAAQLSLARAEDTLNFAPGSLGVALLFFASVEAAIPNLVDRPANGTNGGLVGFVREGLPFPVTDHQDLQHFLAVARNRNVLEPHIARPAEISDRRAAMFEETADEGLPTPRTRAAVDWSSPLDAGVIARPKHHTAR